MINLKKCVVDFNETYHTYTYNHHRLHGITKIIQNYFFPCEFDKIPKFVLDKACEKGSLVHKQVENYVKYGIPIYDEVALKYLDLNLKNIIASEYLVSDYEYYASCVDLVQKVEGGVKLLDIKTTSKLHLEKLKWQLSIYRYLFELINPEIKVIGAAAVWLPKKLDAPSELVEIELIDKNIIEEFLNIARYKLPYNPKIKL